MLVYTFKQQKKLLVLMYTAGYTVADSWSISIIVVCSQMTGRGSGKILFYFILVRKTNVAVKSVQASFIGS